MRQARVKAFRGGIAIDEDITVDDVHQLIMCDPHLEHFNDSAPTMISAKVHHVVYCVRAENQERAAGLWRDVGMTFQEVPLEEEGIRVLLDWSAGVEIVAPTEREGTETARFRAFLDECGEGVYSVVVRTAEIDGPIEVLAPYGASVRYRQHRETGDIVVDEADLTPVMGMSITLLATNLPDET
jgi:methylmalonyl-CoA/ethylmalonyl-CoA epimerase